MLYIGQVYYLMNIHIFVTRVRVCYVAMVFIYQNTSIFGYLISQEMLGVLGAAKVRKRRFCWFTGSCGDDGFITNLSCFQM